MNPYIRKFWEDSGKEICHQILNPNSTYYTYYSDFWFYYLPKYATCKLIIAIKNDSGVAYSFNEEWVSEEKALRIIKMKAFL